jgi:pimeloyl-ACP methyl ester carboxylesterase
MAAIPASFNSTIVRSNITLTPIVRAYFVIASRLLPDVARRQAERLFTAPPRYAGRAVQPIGAKLDSVASGRHSIAVWQAGPSDAPAVLLVHGWGGRGVQLASFVEPLVESGYRVVWFDQPGHGESGRGSVAMPDFVRALHAIAAQHGPFVAAVGHSLGAAALGVALRDGLALGRVVFLSAPASISEHAHRFARMLGITPAIREAMRNRLERRYGMRFAEIDRIDELARLELPALFVHDRRDSEVPFDNAVRLTAGMPRAHLTRTDGLGHFRLLRDPGVVRAVVGFVRGDTGEPPSELPVLPRPAPLY